ncbi:hypothetical protein SBA4_4580037 [Candidatus Sulfopaludibacter sp. SbA4]|nr:hypothetical protein SBA4_4580037 [Candidatus Sulfopaludibacter sp. SbA4]
MSLARLDPPRTVAKFATVQSEGGRSVTREIEFYRLEVILAVGYRVKSVRGTQFRQWATAQLQQYLVKGFAMDDERQKQAGGGGCFDELLDRIRDIRSSERISWRKVLRAPCDQAAGRRPNQGRQADLPFPNPLAPLLRRRSVSAIAGPGADLRYHY